MLTNNQKLMIVDAIKNKYGFDTIDKSQIKLTNKVKYLKKYKFTFLVMLCFLIIVFKFYLTV
jgi:hypothetical protein